MSDNHGKRTRWLVDLENVGSRWREVLDMAAPGDAVHLFYSYKTVKISIQDLGPASARGLGFEFHECRNGMPNAMDFQIMCALGMLAAGHPDDGYVLFTADKGFSSVLEYMADRGVDVRCTAPGMHADEEPPETTQPPMNEDTEPRTVYRTMLRDAGLKSDDVRVMTAILMESMKLPANRRKLDCRNRMLKRWGNADGTAMYQKLKDVVHEIANNGPWPDKTSMSAANPTAENVTAAMSAVDLEPPDGLAGKVMDMIAAANKTVNPAQSLRDQLFVYYKDKNNADRSLEALKGFLKC